MVAITQVRILVTAVFSFFIQASKKYARDFFTDLQCSESMFLCTVFLSEHQLYIVFSLFFARVYTM